jgi:hypothetical protein
MRVTSWAAIMQPFGDVLTFEQFCAIRERLFELKGMIESKCSSCSWDLCRSTNLSLRAFYVRDASLACIEILRI